MFRIYKHFHIFIVMSLRTVLIEIRFSAIVLNERIDYLRYESDEELLAINEMAIQECHARTTPSE